MSSNIIMPVVHMNGTGAKSLLDQRDKAWEAVDDAITALCAMAPNGRDYYPQGPEALDAALDQHRRRLTLLRELQDELKAEMDYIADFV